MNTTRYLLLHTTLWFLSLSSLGWSATGGPDAFGYTWIDSAEPEGPTYQFIEHTYQAVTVLENNTAIAANIDLAVPWGGIYGEKVGTLRISRNGYITDLLTESGNDETNDCPLPATPSVGGGNRIYVLNDNLELDTSSGKVIYEYFTRSPHSLHSCGVHVITWQNVHHFSGDDTRFSFQALLFDNFDILLQFEKGNPEGGGGSTTGIQNADATIGLNLVCDQPLIAPNSAYLIRPAIITVDTIEDELDSPVGANTSLREAIRDAKDGSRIEFNVPASPAPLIDLSTAGGGQGTRLILNNRNLAIDGSTPANRPTLYGGGSVRHLLVQNSSHLALNEVRLTHGFSNNLFPAGAGGSTLVEGGSSLIASDCDFTQNFSNNEGGAFFIDDAGSEVHLSHCNVMANLARAAGGAMAVRGTATLTIRNSRLWLNRSNSSVGGALSLRDATVTLTSCDFAENEAVGSNGGAIVANVGVDCELHACTFDSNAGLNGGAIAAENGASTASLPAQFLISRCTFFENLALASGGAIYENSSNLNGVTATFDIRHSTFYKNGCGVSGGAFAVTNAIPGFQGVCVAKNTAEGRPDDFVALGTGSTLSFGDNLESGSDMGFTNGGIDTQNTDPLLTDLGYYGGFVRTCIPLQGSPLIDAAIQGNAASAFDARGIASFQDGDPATNSGIPGLDYDDIGAVELAPTTLLVNTNFAQLQAAVNAAPRGGTIRISNSPRVDFNGALLIPSNSMVFIESDQPTIFARLRLSAISSQIAFHGIDFEGGSYNNAFLHVSNSNPYSEASSLSFHRCQIRNYINSNDEAIRSLGNSHLSLAACEVRENSSEGTLSLDGEGHSIRGTHFAKNSPSGRTVRDASLVRIQGPALISRSSFNEQEIDSGTIGGSAIFRFTTFSRDESIIARIRNCTIANNLLTTKTNSLSGQPILCEIEGQSFSVPWFILFDHLTIAGNSLSGLGSTSLMRVNAFYPTNFFSITNSILADNVANTTLDGLSSGGGNLFDDSPSGIVGTDLVDTDPLLGPIALGREGTRHLTLLPGSPAIDAALATTAGLTDGRGTIRYIDGDSNSSIAPDIGAVESGRVLTVNTTVDEDDGGLGIGVGDSLRECLAEADLLPVNIEFAVSATSLKVNSALMLDTPQTADLNLALDAITLEYSPIASTNQFFESLDCSLLFLGGAEIIPASPSLRGFLASEGATQHLHFCRIRTDSTLFVRTEDQAAFLGTAITASDFTFPSAAAFIDIEAGSSAEFSDSTFARIGKGPFVPAIFDIAVQGRLFLEQCTVTENGARPLTNKGSVRLLRNSFYRNGGSIGNSNEASSLITTAASVLAQNFGTQSLKPFSGAVHSEGQNLSNLGDSFYQNSDLTFYSARLAPLFDYDGDGLMECPPLAASPIFNTKVGASPPPTEVLIVTTTSNELNTPAGANLSLQEAIRDIAPGGTINFDPSLNGASFTLNNLAISKSLTIDATSLPSGVDFIGRAFTNTAGITLACHGIHFRDSVAESGDGGSLYLPDGNLVASCCTFSGNTGFSFGGAIHISGDMVLENCTFAQLSTSVQAAAIRIEGGTSRITFCTFGECTSPNGGIIDLDSSSPLYLYGCLFYETPRPPVSFGTNITSAFNLFRQTTVSFATATDAVGVPAFAFRPYADYGGYAPTYSYQPATGFDNFITDIGENVAQAPERDGRGFIRLVQSGIEPGSHEFGGEIAYGSDPADLFGDDDEIPAWWELDHGYDPSSDDDTTLDSDGDGSSLAEEFAWLTDPDDAASFFSCQLIAGPALQWTTEPGYQYRVEESDTLLSFDWSEVETRVGDGSPETFTLPIDPDNTAKNFFRIKRVSP